MPVATSTRRLTVLAASLFGFSALIIVSPTILRWRASRVFRVARFDPTEWRTHRERPTDTSCKRGAMAGDLVDRVLRVGMSPKEVELLLGVPDATAPSEFQYYLGACSGFRMDADILHVHFSTQARLTRSTIRQH